MESSSMACRVSMTGKGLLISALSGLLLGLVGHSAKAQQTVGAAAQVIGVIADWHFNEVPKGFALEVISGRHDRVVGISQRTDGPIGPAIQMDGYTTAIQGPPNETIARADNFSISCWIHVDAYPWNELPIIDQIASDHSMVFGIDAEGRLDALITTNGHTRGLKTIESLPLRRWLLLTLSVEKDGEIAMTVNGRISLLKKSVDAASVQPKGSGGPSVLIGHVRTPLMPGPPEAIHPQLPIEYSLEGSFGSLTVYDHALVQAEVNALYSQRRSDESLYEERRAPSFPTGDPRSGGFGAFYTSLKYEPLWDRTRRLDGDSDVVVRFPDSPVRLVFWQGANYVPAWVTENNRWYSDEFMEVYGHPRCPYGEDCEPMSDKQVRYSQVKILESTPARAVIHWRYALSEVEHYAIADTSSPTAWGDWADEYWTVFPDGVAVRRQVLWSTSPERDKTEFQESIVLVPAGERPEDSINFDALTFANLTGEHHTYSWVPKKNEAASYPQVDQQFNEPAHAVIQWVNLKSVWKPFEVALGDPVTFDSYTRERSLSTFEWWNHWPVAQIPSSGRPALAPDRPGHTSLSHIYWPFYNKQDASLEKVLLTGLTNKPANELIPLALSWRQPATADDGEADQVHYDVSQRAYVLSASSAGPFTVTLHGSRTNPVVNPSFIVKTSQVAATLTAVVKPPDTSARVALGRVEGLTQTELLAFVAITSEKDVRITFTISH